MFDNDDLLELDGAAVEPRKILEKDIEKKVCAYAERKGWRAMKFVSPNYRSVPDRIFFKATARVFFIEFKAPGKTPTAKQAKEILRLVGEGFTVFVIDNVAAGYAAIDEMK
jgi:hypothetical protein